MSNSEFDLLIEKWRLNKGIGTFVSLPNLYPIISIINKTKEKCAGYKILIVTNSFSARKQMIEKMSLMFPSEDIKVLTQSYLEKKGKGFGTDLIFCYNISYISNILEKCIKDSKFKFVLIPNTVHKETLKRIQNIVPIIK